MNRYTWRTGVLEVVMILFTALYAVPLWMLLSVSFRSAPAIAAVPLGLPDPTYLANFSTVWTQGNLGRAFLNSIIVTVASVVAIVVLGATASYYFARSVGKGGSRWFLFVVAGIMIPVQLGVLPLYQTFTALGLNGSLFSVIAVNAGTQLPLSVLLYTGFMRQLPEDYEEAARIDGASTWRTFTRVVIPLMLPATGTVVILTTVAIWNEFFTPLIYLSGTPNVTVPVQIFSFVGEFSTNWGAVFAGLLLASLPVLVLFFTLQRYVIRGFASGLRG